jgi:hypothetical protein
VGRLGRVLVVRQRDLGEGHLTTERKFSTRLAGDREVLEKVQEKAVKMVAGLRSAV